MDEQKVDQYRALMQQSSELHHELSWELSELRKLIEQGTPIPPVKIEYVEKLRVSGRNLVVRMMRLRADIIEATPFEAVLDVFGPPNRGGTVQGLDIPAAEAPSEPIRDIPKPNPFDGVDVPEDFPEHGLF